MRLFVFEGVPLHTGAGLLTERQQTRLDELFHNDQHVEVEATRERSISGWLPPTGTGTQRKANKPCNTSSTL